MEYVEFLKNKIVISEDFGFDVPESNLTDKLFPHQKDIVLWTLKGGRRAIFASFGLGKTFMQLEVAKQCILKENKPFLIVCPLAVAGEFKRDNRKLETGFEITYITDTDKIEDYKPQIYITNYERVRMGDIDASKFCGVSFDEASILRNLKTETTNYVLSHFKKVPYRFVATATPTPNDYIEILNYADYLGVISRGHALTRFFQRDSTKAGHLTLYPNKKREFWMWVSTWAVFVNKPSDLGYSDEGYDLPEINITEHCVSVDSEESYINKDGELVMFKDISKSLIEVSREKRESIKNRCDKAYELAKETDSAIVWHHLESERQYLERLFKDESSQSVYGGQTNALKEKLLIGFSENKYKYLLTKAKIAGSGCNFQDYCHTAIFAGIDYKFNDFIQAIHRIYRFGQTKQVNLHIIYTENEYEVLKVLYKKWEKHKELQNNMIELVKEFGLNKDIIKHQMERQLFKDGKKIIIGGATLYNNDTVIVHADKKEMPDNSVHMILTSIPFGDHYEYSDNYNDMGHNHGNGNFFKQMEFLTPNLFRVLKPGRIAAIHVKDRIRYSYQNGTKFTTIDDFSGQTVANFTKQHVKDKIILLEDILKGLIKNNPEERLKIIEELESEINELKSDYANRFHLIGKITVTTDVVRENNQTYRLGWTEQCKDATKMGVGMPEYILLFRKPPTQMDNAYADEPVEKSKDEYDISTWQLDAHAYYRSDGNRFLSYDELQKFDFDRICKAWKKHNEKDLYSYAEHLKTCQDLEELGKLSKLFTMLPVHSNNDSVWTDVNRMNTLNAKQVSSKKEKHICLAEGTLILTQKGYIPIEDVEIGDITLTHKGRWKPIIAKELTRKGANVIQTKAQGVPYLVTTPDHKLYTKKHKGYRPSETFVKSSPEWIEAKETQSHYLNQKLPPEIHSNISAKDWWVIGRWLADGHIDYRGHQYIVSIGNNKILEFRNIAKQYISTEIKHEGCVQFPLINLPKEVRYILSKCGKGAENKTLPIELISLNKELSESLLLGYLSGDGHIDKKGKYHVSSVSRSLLLGFSIVAQRAWNVIPSVYAGKKGGKYMIEGREVNTKQCWVMMIQLDGKHSFGKILEDGAWKKVSKIENKGTSDVWNIRVEEDESYTAEGCIVKNCPLQIDIIKRLINRFTMKGEIVDDPFGGLFSTPYVAMEMERRSVSVELNSEYYRDGLSYIHAMHHKMNIPTLFDLVA